MSKDVAGVVIPTIGRPSLSTAIGSLKSQTNPRWKAYVIGDGPISYKEDPSGRIFFVEASKTGSAGLTRDHGIDMALEEESEFIVFLDDDDRLAPTYIERLETKIDEPWDIVVFKMLHPTQGVIPNDDQVLKTGTVSWANVGISFAVRSEFLRETNLRFGREDVTKPGPQGNEDIRFLNSAIDQKARLVIDPTIQYYVRNAKEDIS